MKALLEAGASVKIFAMDDMSAMHFAAQKGHAEVVNVLLNHGTSSMLRRAKLPCMSLPCHLYRASVPPRKCRCCALIRAYPCIWQHSAILLTPM